MTGEDPQVQPLQPALNPQPSGKILFNARLGHEQIEIFIANADGTDLRQLTEWGGFNTDPAWSPDGTRIAFSATCFGTWEICMMNADGSDLQQVTRSEGPWTNTRPTWSPDGEHLVFESDRDTFNVKVWRGVPQLYSIKRDGTDLRRLTRDTSRADYHATWSPDGKQIAFASNGVLETITPDGKQRRTFAQSDVYSYSWPAWSPDGSRLALCDIGLGGGLPNILTMAADGTDVQLLGPTIIPGTAPRWSPDMRYIVFDSSDYSQKYAIYIATVDGTGVMALGDVPYPSRGAAWSPI